MQALASERELLVALFGDDAAEGAAGHVEEAMSPRSRPPDMPSTSALLDQVFESICRPLKVSPQLAENLPAIAAFTVQGVSDVSQHVTATCATWGDCTFIHVLGTLAMQ